MWASKLMMWRSAKHTTAITTRLAIARQGFASLSFTPLGKHNLDGNTGSSCTSSSSSTSSIIINPARANVNMFRNMSPVAAVGEQQHQQHRRTFASSSSSSEDKNKNNDDGNRRKQTKVPRRRPGKSYQQRHHAQAQRAKRKPQYALKHNVHSIQKNQKGPKDPNDITRRIPKIDFSEKVDNITNVMNESYEEEVQNDADAWMGPLLAEALEAIERGEDSDYGNSGATIDDIETQLKMMDYFISQPGSTEDLVGERRILSMEEQKSKHVANTSTDIQAEINRIVEKQRVDYLELPTTDIPSEAEMAAAENGGSAKIPSNRLAHGQWGEMLIRTDRVCKMWRGGRIDSYRALVIGGNLKGCAGFGIGKAFEPEDAVELASRMARRNIFFVDRYRNRSLTRDLMGRQNSCKVYLRSTDNGLRGNPLACEILKLMGITNAVCKAHGNRNHYNVVRATFKALQTHESLDEIALKRGVRLVNLQKAKRLQI